MTGRNITLHDLAERARVYEGGYIRPPAERRAVARQSIGLLAALVIFGGVVVMVTLALV